MSETTDDFYQIAVNSIPLIDVRAPVEFNGGSFPNTVNLPLMNDDERHRVGRCYKELGQEEAIRLGHRLVSGEIKEARIAAWTRHLNAHPESLIFCFRGGLRSQLSQQWASLAGNKPIVRLKGGYKAFRGYLMGQLDHSAFAATPIILGGRTGVCKTRLLQTQKNRVDLELLANHRGSSFGAFISPQPSQIDFENALAYALIQHQHQGHKHLIVEDEGRHVGSRYLPKSLSTFFAEGDLVILSASLEERIHNTIEEYVTGAQMTYQHHFGAQGIARWKQTIQNNIAGIQRRLGGERTKRILSILDAAVTHQESSGSASMHGEWIEMLLREYYDPMYDFQLRKKSNKIVFKGEYNEVHAYLASLH